MPLDNLRRSIIKDEKKRILTPPESREEINRMYQVDKMRQENESSIWKMAPPPSEKIDTPLERERRDQNMKNKIKKMEMARKMLKM